MAPEVNSLLPLFTPCLGFVDVLAHVVHCISANGLWRAHLTTAFSKTSSLGSIESYQCRRASVAMQLAPKINARRDQCGSSNNARHRD